MRHGVMYAAVIVAIAGSLAFSSPALAQSMGEGERHSDQSRMQMDDDDRAVSPGMMGMMGGVTMNPGMMGMMGHGFVGHGMMGHGMMGPMMLVMMDTDGDKAISFEEMAAVHRRMFDLVDADGDGKVTMSEMREFHSGMWDDE